MSLDVKVGNDLAKWHHRHEQYRPIMWASARLLYQAEGKGPDIIEGPALVVFDSHNFSTDAMLTAYVKSYLAMIAREDRTPFSFLAHYGGGPTFKETSRSHASLFKQFQLLLNAWQVVGLFPFSDVHNGQPRYTPIKAAINWENEGKVPQVKYVAGSIKYTSRIPFTDKPPRFWPTYWPLWFLSKAEVRISTNAVLLSQLPSTERTVDGLVNALREESRILFG